MKTITLSINIPDKTSSKVINSFEEKLMEICDIFKVEYTYKHGNVEIVKYDTMLQPMKLYEDDDIQ